MHALVAQSCPTLCDPMACSPPGFPLHGIPQARILEWVAIPFSRYYSLGGHFVAHWHLCGRRKMRQRKHTLCLLVCTLSWNVVKDLIWGLIEIKQYKTPFQSLKTASSGLKHHRLARFICCKVPNGTPVHPVVSVSLSRSISSLWTLSGREIKKEPIRENLSSLAKRQWLWVFIALEWMVSCPCAVWEI